MGRRPSPEARPAGIAAALAGGDGTELAEAEADGRQNPPEPGVLVKAGRQTDGIPEAETKQILFQRRMVVAQKFGHDGPGGIVTTEQLADSHLSLVNALRVQTEKERSGQPAITPLNQFGQNHRE